MVEGAPTGAVRGHLSSCLSIPVGTTKSFGKLFWNTWIFLWENVNPYLRPDTRSGPESCRYMLKLQLSGEAQEKSS